MPQAVTNADYPLLAIFGGSFNPVHLGHVRLVVEILEMLNPTRFDILPSAHPPHKGKHQILPFALRVELLHAATRGLPKVFVNTMENERNTPSFTAETLHIYTVKEPGYRLAFVIGAEDFSLIHSWRDWQSLPHFADIVVVPRAESGCVVFNETVRTLWPESASIPPPCPAVSTAWALPGCPNAGRFLYLPLPRLDIRAELIRKRLQERRSTRFLVPDAVHDILQNHPEANALWK